jgi:hypothetical protein
MSKLRKSLAIASWVFISVGHADEFVGIKADESEGVLVLQERQLGRTDDEALKLYDQLDLPERDLGSSKTEKSFDLPSREFELKCQKTSRPLRFGSCQVVLRKSPRVELVAQQREMNFIVEGRDAELLSAMFKAGPTLRFQSRSSRVQFHVEGSQFRFKASQKLIGRPPGP